MAQALVPFEKRLRNITRRHDRMRYGVIHRIERDGLITAHPRRRAPRFPLQGVMMLVGAGMLFKAFLYLSLGGTVYEERVAALQSGSVIEQGGGWIMQADPATLWLASQINAIIH
jgi:hypothetical protein